MAAFEDNWPRLCNSWMPFLISLEACRNTMTTKVTKPQCFVDLPADWWYKDANCATRAPFIAVLWVSEVVSGWVHVIGSSVLTTSLCLFDSKSSLWLWYDGCGGDGGTGNELDTAAWPASLSSQFSSPAKVLNVFTSTAAFFLWYITCVICRQQFS